jgi:hypothetical protein
MLLFIPIISIFEFSNEMFIQILIEFVRTSIRESVCVYAAAQQIAKANNQID